MSVSIYEAKTHLSRLVERAEAGEETILTRHGRPVAKLAPLDPQRPRVPGALKGRIVISADFDELSPSELADWYETDAR
ncbi:MAG: type II toxin-antitoxin system Phd/YefM family antitoxin [Propionibacteriaceae bacterium]|jgi:prevent-host-death family protein|nr:type II toxin-antitoxin system Phd/YefM family antitoxin [Propionibacteriaceae bacterium]